MVVVLKCSRCSNEALPGLTYCATCKEHQRDYSRTDDRREWRKRERERVRAEVLAAYGGKCACCGEDAPEFLTIDHVDGVPERHRRPNGARMKGADIYRLLRKEGFPPDCQILCFNCNNAKAIYGVCPHEVAVVRAAA